jgi:hypothetical protein
VPGDAALTRSEQEHGHVVVELPAVELLDAADQAIEQPIGIRAPVRQAAELLEEQLAQALLAEVAGAAVR